ncbi:MAG: spore coat associated protein CotJA [Clostridia bacterium]|nr:spore coat associated protein CotJA [Clostridia bacterium]
MVYSPCQSFDNLYDPEIGIDRGTIFKELDKPFMPTPCNERWCR